MANNVQIIRDFIAAWSNLDVDELVDYFAVDGTYHNMPARPVSGHDNLRKFISAFITNWEKTEWEIINLLANGEIVMVERMDRTVAGGKSVELPCFGIFEMCDGKIAEWRDYFDMATFTNAVS